MSRGICSRVVLCAVRSMVRTMITSVRDADSAVIVSLPSSRMFTALLPDAFGRSAGGGIIVTGVLTGVSYVPRITIVGIGVGVTVGVRVGEGVRVLVGVRVADGVRFGVCVFDGVSVRVSVGSSV